MNSLQRIFGDESYYQSIGNNVYPLSCEDVIIVNENTGKHVRYPSFIGDAINRWCTPFTLKEQYVFLRNRLGTLKAVRTRIETLLAELVDEGIIVPAQLKKRDGLGIFNKDNAVLQRCILTTADRPQGCLQTAHRAASELSNRKDSIRLLIVDGSTHARNEIQLREAVSTGQLEGVTVNYVGTRERTMMCERLVNRGFAKPMCEGLLLEAHDAFSAGSARNVAMLMTVGESILLLDDDVQLSVHQDVKNALECLIGSSSHPRTWNAYKSRAEAISGVSAVETGGMLNAIERCLGKKVSSLYEEWPGSVDFSAMCSHQLTSLLQPAAHIPVVQMGVVGDSAMHTGQWVGMINADLQERLQSSDAFANTVVESREVVNIARAMTITLNPSCMAYGLALDNNSILPPFAPRYRNEDGVFGFLLRVCDPLAHIAHMPYGVLHDADPCRSYDAGVALRTSDVVFYAIREIAALCGSNVVANYALVGQYLTNLHHASRQSFRVEALKWAAKAYQYRLDFINSALDKHRRPGRWREQLVNLRKNLHREIAQAEFAIPKECRISNDQDKCLAQLKSYLALLGASLLSWVDLRDASRDYGNLNMGNPR